MRFVLLLTIISLSAGLALSQVGSQDTPKGIATEPSSDDWKELVKGNNEFALDLYARLAKVEGNIFLSPYSISTCLAMPYAGARGQTAEQMAKTLHFTLPPERFHAVQSKLAEILETNAKEGGYSLNVASALWVQRGFPIVPTFADLMGKQYRAGLRIADFEANREEARRMINDWAEDNTKHKIKEFLQLDDLNDKTRMVLANAIYFCGPWAEPFGKNATKDAPFFLSPTKQLTTAIMHETIRTGYFRGDGVQVVALPYRADHVSMIAILAERPEDLGKVERNLTAQTLAGFVSNMKPHVVDLYLPQIRLKTRQYLQDIAQAMGMVHPFRQDANFSGITAEHTYLQQVVHQAFIEVGESGTEAAAATAVVAAVPSAASNPLPSALYRADRPFLIVIRENSTGIVLFLGRVSNPMDR